MAFDVVVLGTLSLPEPSVEEWLASPVEPGAFPWLDGLAGGEVLQDTPEALLSALAEQARAPHELLEVSLTEGRLAVQAYCAEDTYREVSQALALLFASAAPFGGVGTLTFAGYRGLRFGEAVTVRGGHAAFSLLGPEALCALERRPDFAALDARIHARFDALVGRAAGPLDARSSRVVVNPFTGRTVRVAAPSEGSAR